MGAAGSVVKYEDIGAYLVTVVKPGSPGAKAGLQEKVDFIKSMNGVDLISVDEQKIVDLVETSIGKPIELQVYSSSTGEMRTVQLTPNNDWAGEAGDGLLGIKIRLSLYENCMDELGDLVQFNSVPKAATGTGKGAEADSEGKSRTALPSFDTADAHKQGEGVVPEATADDNSCAQELPLNVIDADPKQQSNPTQAEAVLLDVKSKLLQEEASVAVSAKAEVVAPAGDEGAAQSQQEPVLPAAAEVEVEAQ